MILILQREKFLDNYASYGLLIFKSKLDNNLLFFGFDYNGLQC